MENIRKRLQKGLEDRVRQLSEAREKMNDDGENISHYLVELEKKVIHKHTCYVRTYVRMSVCLQLGLY